MNLINKTINDDLHVNIQHRIKQASVGKHTNVSFDLAIDLVLPLSQGVVGVFGNSGAGKSTLLQIIAGLNQGVSSDKHSKYNIHWHNKFINNTPADKNPCLLQTQQAQLFPNLTVMANLTFVIKHSAWASSCSFTLEQVIDWCGIEHLLAQPSISLSGGEQQRVNLARSLLCGKPIILLDEPFSALDWNARTELLSLLVELQQNYNLHFVIVSHSLKELALTSQNLVVIESGKVIEVGTSETLIPRLITASKQSVFSKLELSNPEVLPQHNLTKWQLTSYLSSQTNSLEPNIIEKSSANQNSTVHDKSLVIYSKGLADLTSLTKSHSSKAMVIDANRISLSKKADITSSMLNHLPAQITEIKTIQDSVLVTVNVKGQHLFAEISQLSLEKLTLNVGDHIFAQFKAV